MAQRRRRRPGSFLGVIVVASRAVVGVPSLPSFLLGLLYGRGAGLSGCHGDAPSYLGRLQPKASKKKKKGVRLPLKHF